MLRTHHNTTRAPDPLPSGSATGGTADSSSPAVPPNPIEPSESCVDPTSEGKGGAVRRDAASPEPDLPTFLRRTHG